MRSVPVTSIKVGKRFRQDMGDLQSLADSIETVGLLHPVVITSDGLLIAGQRRLAACVLLGWSEIPITEVNLEEAALGEKHENLARKDLLPSEMVAIKRIVEPIERALAQKRQGARTDLHPAKLAGGGGESRDRIASYLGIGRTTLDKAKEVVEAAEENPEEYGHLVDQMDRSGKISGAYRKLIVQRQAKSLEKEAATLPSGPFRVIVADPPWRYESGGSLPYPTMAFEEIRAMPVQSISAADSVLWLWTTNAHLRVAFDVVDAWGFEYRTLLTWVKDRMGTGDWLRGQTEHCLLAVRGKPTFINGTHTTVLEAARREHSRKPEEFFELVETTCPGNKVELFSRRQRVGWEAFGNDTNRFDGK